MANTVKETKNTWLVCSFLACQDDNNGKTAEFLNLKPVTSRYLWLFGRNYSKIVEQSKTLLKEGEHITRHHIQNLRDFQKKEIYKNFASLIEEALASNSEFIILSTEQQNRP